MTRRRTSRLNLEPSDLLKSTEEFSFTLTRVAVSQICQSIGYESTDFSALDTLTLITTKFLQSIAGEAVSFANSANRTEVNLFDIVNGLHEVSLYGYDCLPGGSMLHDTESHCLIKSAVVRNLADFVACACEIPFAKPLPRPEIDRSVGGDLTCLRLSEERSEMNSIPAWLPPFPDSSLYIEDCTEMKSNHLWENSDSVIVREDFTESTKSESSRDGIGGSLPQKRERVRFKIGRDRSNGGGSCKSTTRIEQRRDNNDGGFGRELEGKKKIRDEFMYSPGIAATVYAGDGEKIKTGWS